MLPLIRRLLPGGLRAQVTLAIALITALAIGLSLLAVYRGIGVRLRDRIDAELTTQVAEWDQLRASADLSTPVALTQTAKRFLAAQRYHPAARIFAIDVAGGAPVTNQPDVLASEAERERQEGRPRSTGDGRGALPAPMGLATVEVAEAGRLRVLSDPISDHGRRVGTLQIADPLRSVQDAQDSLLRTFALVGSLAVILAILAGLTIATLIARPVRRMADVAAAVDACDLSLRAGEIGARGSSGCWPAPSTGCWPGWSARSHDNATSSPTRPMSCVPRWPSCGHRSRCSTAKPTTRMITRRRQRCFGDSTRWIA